MKEEYTIIQMIQVKWATGITNVPLRWDIWRFYYPWRFSWVAAKHGEVYDDEAIYEEDDWEEDDSESEYTVDKVKRHQIEMFKIFVNWLEGIQDVKKNSRERFWNTLV